MHQENMEAMTKKVADCILQGNFDGKLLSSLRGVKDDKYIFDDEDDMKEFFSF